MGRGWSTLTAVLRTVRPEAVQRPGPARPVEVVGSSSPRRVEQRLLCFLVSLHLLLPPVELLTL